MIANARMYSVTPAVAAKWRRLLGLAISRSLAELHGGSLRIRSTQGVGTIVCVRIPSEEIHQMAA